MRLHCSEGDPSIQPSSSELPSATGSAAGVRIRGIQATLVSWQDSYTRIEQTHSDLANFVQGARQVIQQMGPGEIVRQYSSSGPRLEPTGIPATIQEFFCHPIGHEPFLSCQRDPQQTLRFAQLSNVLESYSTFPFASSLGGSDLGRGSLRIDRGQVGQLDPRQLGHLDNPLVGLLVSERLNDPGDEDVICPRGRFPITTVHQAKGLQFPFVFVSGLAIQQVSVSPEVRLEDDLSPCRMTPARGGSSLQRFEQDAIQLFCVAYSRAEYALIAPGDFERAPQPGLGVRGTRQTVVPSALSTAPSRGGSNGLTVVPGPRCPTCTGLISQEALHRGSSATPAGQGYQAPTPVQPRQLSPSRNR